MATGRPPAWRSWGFDVRCENVLPQELNLVLRAGAGQVFRRALAAQVTSTGLWHSLAVAVTSTNQGRWIGGSEAAFAAALTNIMAFEIEIARSGPGVAQLYLVDNVYVEERPGALDITAVADQHQLSWSPLRSNRTYRLQRAAGPTSGWTDHQAVIATNTVTTWTVDATNGSAGVWRLLNLVH